MIESYTISTLNSLDLDNGSASDDDSNTLIYSTFWHELRRFNYILHSRSLQSSGVSVNLQLNLRSDHRNVSISISYKRSVESFNILRNDPLRSGTKLEHIAAKILTYSFTE